MKQPEMLSNNQQAPIGVASSDLLDGVSRYNRTGIIHRWEKGKDGNLYSECGQWESLGNMQPASEGTRWCKKCARIIEKETGIATPPNEKS